MLLATLLVTACASRGALSGTAQTPSGRDLAHDWQKGNCLACHQIPGDTQAQTSADIGPPLVGLAQRFANKQRLREQIWDARINNPETVMPPFGKNKILTDDEIDKIVDYLFAY